MRAGESQSYRITTDDHLFAISGGQKYAITVVV